MVKIILQSVLVLMNVGVSYAFDPIGVNETILYDREILYLASIIEGEAGNCDKDGKLAIAHVFSRNKTMLGWSDNVTKESMEVAENWWRYPDPTYGAYYIVSKEDVMLEEIIHIMNNEKMRKENIDKSFIKSEFECKSGLGLYSF